MPDDHPPPNRVLRSIAVFKFVEALIVSAFGFGALKLLNPNAVGWIGNRITTLPFRSAQVFAQKLLNQLSGVSPHEIESLGIGAFALAAIFLTEGVGLWIEARWAEWLAVVATSLFVPLEILELLHRVTTPKLLALVVNLLVVGYLVLRIVATGHRPPRTT